MGLVFLITRSKQPDAMERPIPVNLLRAAVTGISENTKFPFGDINRGSMKYFHLLLDALIWMGRMNRRAKFGWSALHRFGGIDLRT